MQQSSATSSLHLWFLGVAEDCCMLSILLAVPSCIYSFWHGVIPTSHFIFNDFYTCIYMYVRDQLKTWPVVFQCEGINTDGFEAGWTVSQLTINYKRLLDGLKIGCRHPPSRFRALINCCRCSSAWKSSSAIARDRGIHAHFSCKR